MQLLKYIVFRVIFFALFFATLNHFYPGISMISLAIGYTISDLFIFVFKVKQRLKEGKNENI